MDCPGVQRFLNAHPESRSHFAVFASFEPAATATFFDHAARNSLGVGLASIFDYYVGQVPVACAVTDDDRRVAMKLYPEGYESDEVLEASREVQARLARRSVPAPSPIATARTGLGLVAIDEHLPGDQEECTHVRRVAMATALASVVAACPPASAFPALRRARLASHPVTEPSPATPSSLADLTALLRPRLHGLPRDCVAHLDWRIQNVAWRSDQIVAIYDWDSLAVTNEAVAVGCGAGMHSYDFRDPVPQVPTPEMVTAFVDAYPRSIDTVAARAAAGLKMLGHADTEQKLDPSGLKLGPRSYRTALTSCLDEYATAFGA